MLLTWYCLQALGYVIAVALAMIILSKVVGR